MSLGFHIVRRGRAALCASGVLLSTPREPLLFLYPEWIRTVVTNLQKTPSIAHNHSATNAHISDFASAHQNAAVISSEYESLSEKKQGSTPDVQEALSQAAHPVRKGNAPTNDQPQQSLESHGTIAKYPAIEGNAGLFRSTSVTCRILASERKREIRRVYNKRVREDYEERKVEDRIDGVPNWREVLYGLESRTPDGAEYRHDSVLRIRVPFKAVGRLLFSEEDNIWAIKMRCGCQIELSEAHEPSQAHRIVLVSGPVRSIAKAAVEILRAAPGAVPDKEIWSQRVPSFSTKPTSQRPSLSACGSLEHVVRSVRADRHRRMTVPIRADKVPQPPIWTPESFGFYVQNLTTIRMSTHLQRILYKPGESHVDAVVKILQELFVDPKCRTAISAASFNDALAYLVKHNAIHVVRDLFVHMEMQNLRMNTETFNIMLRGTAKSGSIGNFHYIFWLMVRRGYTPNTDTWLAFMRAIDDPQIKAHILESMKSKELLRHPRMQKKVCENFVRMEVQASLDNNMTHEQFLTHMADRYGQDWLTTESANRILDALGSRGLISRCWGILNLMHNQDVKVSDVSILTVLHHCEKQDNAQGAIEIIRCVSSLIGLEPSQEIYHTLFNIAWKARLHCMARVVWRYACLSAATTYIMRRRIISGVQTAISRSSQSPALKFRPRREWAATASRFILGLPIPLPQQRGPLPEDPGNIHPAELSHHPDHASINSVEEDINPTGEDTGQAAGNSNTGKEDAARAMISAVVKEQLQAYQVWAPRRHFADVLVEAFEIDKEWVSSGESSEDDRLEWLLLKVPAVPLSRKGPWRRRTPWGRGTTLLRTRWGRRRVSMWVA